LGFLDSKSRLLDTFLTDEGRKQIASGRLRAVYYSFSDAEMDYDRSTVVSGGLDETYRPQLEAGSTVFDRIALQADDSGRLVALNTSASFGYPVLHGQFLSSSADVTKRNVPVTASQFSSLSETLLDSSLANLRNLFILGSADPSDLREKSFSLSTRESTFIITAKKPISQEGLTSAHIDSIEALFQDRRLSHIPNFQFLPPVNKPRLGTSRRSPLGVFVDTSQGPILSFEEVDRELRHLDALGFSTTVEFSETSKQNNLFCQFYESADGVMTKLDVVDFGEFAGPEGSTRHVFFAGKVFKDSTGSHTFVNLFTLVFEG
jgi:hypothetical protein